MAKKKSKVVKELRGDIFQLASELDFIVIPTNIGWTREGANVMGAGLARKATQEDPSLPLWYGEQCRTHGANTPVMSRGRFLLFPVKPLKVDTPWLSWMAKAHLPTIERSMLELRKWKRPNNDKRSKILIPLVGCGNGKLTPEEVRPLLEAQWMNRYRLIRWDSKKSY